MTTVIVKFNKEENYKEVCSLFDSWEWTTPDLDQIPEESYIVYVNSILVGFSCFAKTDTSCAIMGFTVARKDRIEGQSEALDDLINLVLDRVKACGFKYLQYYTDSELMVKRMERLGMEVTDRANAYILLKNINGDNHRFYDE